MKLAHCFNSSPLWKQKILEVKVILQPTSLIVLIDSLGGGGGLSNQF